MGISPASDAIAALPFELRELAAEYLQAQLTADALVDPDVEAEFTDDEVGPWYYDDGRLWTTPPSDQRIGRPVVVAPAHHPRRCHARVKRLRSSTRDYDPVKRIGRRCQRWACRGSRVCSEHSGRRKNDGGMRVRNTLRRRYRHSSSRLPEVYGKHLAPRLAKKLSEILDDPNRARQLELYDEIALARVQLCEALDLMTALDDDNEAVDAETRAKLVGLGPEVKVAVAVQVRSATRHVADLCSQMARIQKDMTDMIGSQQLGFVLMQVVEVIRKHLGNDNDDLVRAIADDVRDIKVLADQSKDPSVPLIVDVTYD